MKCEKCGHDTHSEEKICGDCATFPDSIPVTEKEPKLEPDA